METNKTVMIVDEEAIVALNINNLLLRQGYTALVANSGEDCLELFRQGDIPDIILMDINLDTNRMSGPETTGEIHRQYSKIPVILHSAYIDRETIQGTRDMTKYGCVHKVPGNKEFILASVEMAFKLREREEDLLRVTAADDGLGFSPDKLSGARTLGILGMQERAEQRNGTLRITSAPGEGARVVAAFPIPVEAQGEAS